MQAARVWFLTSRPKTLIVSASPVTIGFILALRDGIFSFHTFLVTLSTAILIQVGTNFANDYYDFLKGSDDARKAGPKRGLHMGLLSMQDMKVATLSTFATAFLLSIYLAWIGGWPILCFAILAPFVGIGYTKGPYALAYLGLGDPFVFLFFGPIAVTLTYYLQTHLWSEIAFTAGLGPGLLSTAILAIANVRDVEEDRLTGKNTIPVRFGKNAGLFEYAFCLLGGTLSSLLVGSWLASFLFIPATVLVIKALKGESYPSLLPKTAAILFTYTFLFLIGWFL